MNLDKLKKAEAAFLHQYPEGFNDPEMVKIGKKHKMSNHVEFAQTVFTEESCAASLETIDNMIKLISRSSMVSMFEKPKFRDFAKNLSYDEKGFMAAALNDFLNGDQQRGFDGLVGMLQTAKLGKWSLLTAVPAYYRPNDEVFVKPTTAKGIIAYLEVPELIYKPAPYWEFYQRYRDLINTAKTKVDPSISPSNAAFSGFLMMVLNLSGKK